MSEVTHTFQLVKPGQDREAAARVSPYDPKIESDRYVRTTHQVRSVSRLTPSKDIGSTSVLDGELSSGARFLSPGKELGSQGQRPSEAIVVLKGELVALREEIGRLLTEEDRRKLEERRKNRILHMESPRRVAEFDASSLSSSRGDSRSERAYILGSSSQGFNAEQMRHLATENETLKSDLKSLQAKYDSKKQELKEKNQVLVQKVQTLETMLANNESYMRDYKADIEVQFDLLRKANHEAARIPAQELERLTRDSNLLRAELDILRSNAAKKQQEEIDKFSLERQNLTQQVQRLTRENLGLNRALQEAEAVLEVRDSEMAELRHSVSTSQNQQLQRLSLQNHNLSVELRRLSEQNNALHGDVYSLHKMVSERESEQTSRLHSHNQALESSLEALSRQHESALEVQSQHAQELHLVHEENTTMKVEFEHLRSQYVAMISEQNAELEKCKRLLAEEQLSAQRELASLRTELQLQKSAGQWLQNDQREIAALKEELQTLKAALVRGEGSLRENQVLRDELQRMQGLLANRQGEYDSLLEKHYEENKAVRAATAELEYNCAFLKGELERLGKSLLEKEGELARVLEKAVADVREKDNLVNSLREEAGLLKLKISEHEKNASHFQSHLKTLQSRAPENESALSVLKLEVENTKKQLRQKQDELARKCEQAATLSASHQSTVSSMTQELVAARQKLSDKVSADTEQKIAAQKLSQEVAHLKSQLEIMKDSGKQTQRLSEEYQKSQSHYELKISQLADKLEAERAEWGRQAEELRRANSELSRQLDDSSRVANAKEEEAGKARNEVLAWESKLKEIEASRVGSTSEITSLRANLQSKNENIANLEAMVRRLNLQVEDLRSRNESLEQQLQTDSLRESHHLEKDSLIKEQESLIRNLTDNLNYVTSSTDHLELQIRDWVDKYHRLEEKLSEKDKQVLLKTEEFSSMKQNYERRLAEIMAERERWRMSERYTEQSKLIEHLENELRQQAQNYDDIIRNIKGELQARGRSSSELVSSSNADMASIDSALRGQVEEVNVVKKELEKKNEELYRLKDQISACRSDYDNLRSQFEIEKLKGISERKNLQVAFGIDMQNTKNDLESQRRVNESLAQKIKLLNEDNKKKDGFIHTYIVGKKLEADQKFQLQSFFEQYTIAFPKEGLLNSLFSEVQEIHRLTQENEQLRAQIRGD